MGFVTWSRVLVRKCSFQWGSILRLKDTLAVSVSLLCLGACASMPGQGPSSGSVERKALEGDQAGVEGSFALVDLTYEISQRIALTPSPALRSLSGASSDAQIDLIGVGDTLSITVFEAGPGLFNSSRGVILSNAPETLPRIVVDRSGSISMPFAGLIPVGGKTPEEAAEAIRTALSGKAVSPQVVVTVTENLSNSTTLIGEVRNPGRFPLRAQANTLLDIIASGGGPSRTIGDIEVTVVRGDASASIPLEAVMTDASQNIRLAPRDQVRLVYKPRIYSTFGALTSVSQMEIGAVDLTLAGALSRSGGLDDQKANPSSVLLFRFERAEVANALSVGAPLTPRGVPIVYRLNLRDPSSLFVANNLRIRHDDLIYVPTSNLAEMQKFFTFVQSVTRVVYDVNVAGGGLLGN